MGAERQKKVSKIQTTYVKQQEYAEIASGRKRKLLIRRLSLFLVLACVISYFMISSALSQSAKIEASAAQKKKLNQELTALKKQEQELKQDIVKLNDPEYIAKLARKEYFFSKKDEIIFNIPDEDKEK
ncbi:septum formation initiator family protein [Neobacillus mesonae]|uniref:FtsB family cell division protein n=1 Tax=Neobacillus mesonae TaxID=1193713 RepID=UPI002041241A|nr:septum formation initiator family protein [Neobacillus mesonae]MCM3570794.1 septum formation initiator family protein [Neobacillus mesonae]